MSDGKTSLRKDFDFYLSHKKELMKDYYGKFIVIRKEKVLGGYNTEDDAIRDMQKKGYQLGDFIVQIVKENDGTNASFVSNVYV